MIKKNISNKDSVPVYKSQTAENKEVEQMQKIEQSSNQVRHSTKKGSRALWGRPFWFSLHYGALNLPDVLDSEDQQMIYNFITSIPIFLPCDTCKNHAYDYIKKGNHDFKHIVSTKENVFEFFWRFHNVVNKSVGKPQISLEKAYDIFQNNPESAL